MLFRFAIMITLSSLSVGASAESVPLPVLKRLARRAPAPGDRRKAPSLGERFLVCEGDKNTDGALGKLVDQLDGQPLLPAQTFKASFGAMTLAQSNQVRDSILETVGKGKGQFINRPFRFYSTGILFDRGEEKSACVVVAEDPKAVSQPTALVTLHDDSVSIGKREFPHGSYEVEGGKIQTPNGLEVHPSPSKGKRAASFGEALGTRYLACAEGEDREAAALSLLKKHVFGARMLTVEKYDFEKLTPMDLNQQPGKAAAVLKNGPIKDSRRDFVGNLTLFAPAISHEVKAELWKVCFVVE